MSDQKEKFFLLNLKKNVSKNGKTFYTGKYAYAIDLIAFEKKDGSGDLTLWLQPKDMDLLNQPNKGYARPQQQQGPQERPAQQQRPAYQPRPQFTQPPPPLAPAAYQNAPPPPAGLFDDSDPGPEDPPF